VTGLSGLKEFQRHVERTLELVNERTCETLLPS